MSPRRQLTALSAFGIVGQLVLLASAFVLPMASEFTLLRDTISELVLGAYGQVQIVAFVLVGAATLVLASLLRTVAPSGKQSALGCVLIALYGLSALVCAMFPTDLVNAREDLASLTRSGTVHVASAMLGFVAIVVAMVIMSWAFRRDVRWRSITVPSALLTTSAVSLLLAQSPGALSGLMQRLLVTAISAWLVMIAMRARRLIALSA